jgi:hypothetical protein
MARVSFFSRSPVICAVVANGKYHASEWIPSVRKLSGWHPINIYKFGKIFPKTCPRDLLVHLSGSRHLHLASVLGARWILPQGT